MSTLIRIALFALALRAYLDRQPLGDGLFGLLGDARLGRALRAMLERPEHAWTLEQLAQQAAMSRALSWVSQVKPSPSVCHSTWFPKRSTAVRSPVCQAPLPNCTTPQRNPRPRARSISPKAAVDFPLPLPVWTISRPFSTVFAATSASWMALRLAILFLCRASSSFSFIIEFRPLEPMKLPF